MPSNPIRRAARAYTLIELLIVVALLGLASAMVVPVMSSTDSLRVQSTVRAIVADINYAQSEALARQQARAIIFDIDHNKYTVVDVPGSTVDPSPDNVEYSVDLNDHQKFHDSRMTAAAIDGGNTLIFDELGGPVADAGGTIPSAGGSITVTGSGTTYRIDIEAYTGRVVVTRLGP